MQSIPPFATPFATTEHLALRGYRDSDLPRLLALYNDPRLQPLLTDEYIVPRTAAWSQVVAGWLEKALLVIIIETKGGISGYAGKPSSAASGKENENENGNGNGKSGGPDPEDERWVGFCCLTLPVPKNRDAMLGPIALLPRWQGRGFGVEVLRWTVDYAFGNLGLHRMSLHALEGNATALSLYKRIGFKEEGRRRQTNWMFGEWKDLVSMGIIEEEWAANREDKRVNEKL